jgi:hypothetical protein
MVNVLDLRWMRYVDETNSWLDNVVLTSPRMHRRPLGTLAFFNQKSPPSRWQQSPNIRNDFLETGVRCTLGALQDAKGRSYALTLVSDDRANEMIDLAYLYPLVLLLLLRRNHGHIPLVALLCASTSSIVAPCS